jgi:hypothetical protein
VEVTNGSSRHRYLRSDAAAPKFPPLGAAAQGIVQRFCSVDEATNGDWRSCQEALTLQEGAAKLSNSGPSSRLALEDHELKHQAVLVSQAPLLVLLLFAARTDCQRIT